MPPTTPLRRSAPALALALALVVLASACGSSGSDPETTGPRKQAIERLHDYGLTTTQATCLVDQLGAQTVVEVGDLDALVDSKDYRDAARTCIDGS